MSEIKIGENYYHEPLEELLTFFNTNSFECYKDIDHIQQTFLLRLSGYNTYCKLRNNILFLKCKKE